MLFYFFFYFYCIVLKIESYYFKKYIIKLKMWCSYEMYGIYKKNLKKIYCLNFKYILVRGCLRGFYWVF